MLERSHREQIAASLRAANAAQEQGAGAARGHEDAARVAGDEVLSRLAAASAESLLDAALSLATLALSEGRADLCARWLSAASGSLRALAARGPAVALSRAADLLSRALGLSTVVPSLDEHGVLRDGRDPWALPLAELGAELGDRALDPLRRLRAHLLRARLLVDAGKAGEALPSARLAFALARSALGDDDPVTQEAHALRTAAQNAAPAAHA